MYSFLEVTVFLVSDGKDVSHFQCFMTIKVLHQKKSFFYLNVWIFSTSFAHRQQTGNTKSSLAQRFISVADPELFRQRGGVEKRDPRVNVATCPNIWIMVNVVLIAKNSLGALWIHPCWFKHISVCWQLSAYLCIYGYALLLGVGEGVFVSWRWEFFEVMWVFFISKLAIHSWWPLRKVPVTLSPTFHRFLLQFFCIDFCASFPSSCHKIWILKYCFS